MRARTATTRGNDRAGLGLTGSDQRLGQHLNTLGITSLAGHRLAADAANTETGPTDVVLHTGSEQLS